MLNVKKKKKEKVKEYKVTIFNLHILKGVLSTAHRQAFRRNKRKRDCQLAGPTLSPINSF